MLQNRELEEQSYTVFINYKYKVINRGDKMANAYLNMMKTKIREINLG